MTPLDYGLKESKQGRVRDTKTEQLSGHHGSKQNNHSTFLQIEACSISIDIKKKQRKRRWKQKQSLIQSNTACNFRGRAIGGVKKTKNQKTSFFPRFSQSKSLPLYAALDLGTNNCRLLIASPSEPGYFQVVDAFSRIVRLGEGLVNNGFLNTQAMDRAIEALKICHLKLKQRHIKRYRLVATEACRSAKNGRHFIQRVLDETGLKLEIVDRETEARFAVSGCGTLIEPNTDAIVLFDIGGGSSEIVLLDVSQKRSLRLAEQITAWTSLPVGVVTLAERFGGSDISLNDFEKMKSYVRGFLNNFSDRYKLGTLAQGSKFHLLGTSGTITALAGMHLNLERYDRKKIDGIWMNDADITLMMQRLLSWDVKKRGTNPCIGRERADLILAGCAILDVIREVWPSQRLRVADRGLREGILIDLMLNDGVWRHYKKRRSFKR
ncbi:Ppx/GppA family phosphatase [Bartonella henselae]|uniref:Exopolyphosphatase n=2 Tax=Bartonella TaxID=773 RepID=X5M5Q0_BARHN|nr:Ppx/GppA phosphatase family protein [Bartonella henselae]MDM9996265.1 Ppx/GppA phosphatase family protein [Bartonella henselae]UJM32562.1 Ppx/GppA family phosphatase [Bartonella henselae]UJM42816.1 Ppx/GppA family phosphatase [Bartonella henselae]CDO46188.1 exopolyphosphatase [Bartonella henselae]